jgi:hypothetical protein
LVGAIPKAVVKLANIGAREITHAIMAEDWCYVQANSSLIFLRSFRLAALSDVLRQEAVS